MKTFWVYFWFGFWAAYDRTSGRRQLARVRAAESRCLAAMRRVENSRRRVRALVDFWNRPQPPTSSLVH